MDWKACKAVPLESILRHYGVEGKVQGEFLVFQKCPLPSHASKETETFKVSVAGNWWLCFSASCRAKLGKRGGDAIDLVCFMEGIKPFDAAKKLAQLSTIPTPNGSKVQVSAEIPIPLKGNPPLAWALQGINPQHEMIQSRGISIETAKSFGIGYYKSKQGTASMDDRIVFPLYDEAARLVGYVGRACSNQEPKWRVGKGLHRGLILYGIERCDPEKPVVLCESYWAVPFFWERKQPCAALGGTEMTETQEKRLEGFTTIVVAMDNDEAGKRASAEICERLRARHRIIKATLRE